MSNLEIIFKTVALGCLEEAFAPDFHFQQQNQTSLADFPCRWWIIDITGVSCISFSSQSENDKNRGKETS